MIVTTEAARPNHQASKRFSKPNEHPGYYNFNNSTTGKVKDEPLAYHGEVTVK